MISVLALSFTSPAQAQDGFDAHGFNLVAYDADIRDALTVARPGAMKRNDWFIGGLFEYADQPLVFAQTDADGNEVGEQIVLDNILALNASVGWSLLDEVRLDVTVPLLFTSAGLAGNQGVGLGDLRLAAMISPIMPDADGGFGLGLVPYVDVPSGDETEFVGDGNVSGGVRLAATYELDRLTLSGDIGADFAPQLAALENLTGSDRLTTGIAVGVNPTDTLGFTLEGHLLSPFSASPQSGTAAPGEILFHGRKTTSSGGHFAAGGATAVSQGASAASWRLFVGGGFGSHEPAIQDTDLDGLLDPDDACVTEPETVNSYKDTDGCPDGPGKITILVTRGGVPVPGAAGIVHRADGVGSPFTSSTTPQVFDAFEGTTWSAEATLGRCLAGEGRAVMAATTTQLLVELVPLQDATLDIQVKDPAGAMINTAQIGFGPDPAGCAPTTSTPASGGRAVVQTGSGTMEVRVTAPGYAANTQPVTLAKGETKALVVVLAPSRVQVTQDKIVILDVVYFETNKAIIKPESFGLLDEVATTIRTNPDLGKVEVGGHTDSQGSDAANLDLSQRRSDAVREYLAAKGVPIERLTAKGYGEGVPIADNASAAGRAKNRRVEFKLTDRAGPAK